MKRHIVSAIAPFLLLCVLVVQTAQAAEIRTTSGKPYLSFDGTTATCSVICQGDSTTDKIDATLTLYKGSTRVDSWSDSGTGRVSLAGKCAVKTGKTYTLELTYTINGVEKPTVSATKTCP